MKVPPENYLVAHTDGGARGNPGPAGYGIVIHDARGGKVAALSQYLGKQTNNFAEYSGLLAALNYAVKEKLPSLKVRSDSELLVRQMKGVYKVKSPALQELFAQAQSLALTSPMPRMMKFKGVPSLPVGDAGTPFNRAFLSNSAPSHS